MDVGRVGVGIGAEVGIEIGVLITPSLELVDWVERRRVEGRKWTWEESATGLESWCSDRCANLAILGAG